MAGELVDEKVEQMTPVRHKCYRVKYESYAFGFKLLAAHIIRQAVEEQAIFPLPFEFWDTEGFDTLCGYVNAEPTAVLRLLTKAPVAVETTGACALRVGEEITLDDLPLDVERWIPDLILPCAWIPPATIGTQGNATVGI